jgi:hypothetical protein
MPFIACSPGIRFAESSVPSMGTLPVRQLSKDILRFFLTPGEPEPRSKNPSSPAFFKEAKTTSQGRIYFTTEEAYIGKRPRAIKRGERNCDIIGCKSPLLVWRPTENSQCQVFGNCFVPALMDSEALLGNDIGKLMNVAH